MIPVRIKPKMRPGPARAKALVSYASGKPRAQQISLIKNEIAAVQNYIANLRDQNGAEAASTLKYKDFLIATRDEMIASPALTIDRSSVLAAYATRLSERVQATWCVVAGIAGWSTGDSFYSGVTSPHAADKEFAQFAQMTKRGGHPIEHIVFSWPADEKPTPEQMIYAANQALSKAGFPRDCPRVLGIHDDTDNLHVHAVVSRYRPAFNRTWSKGRLIDELHHACREVEIEMGFKHDNGNSVVVELGGIKKIVDKKFTDALLSRPASAIERRLGVVTFERFIREIRHAIEQTARTAGSWDELHEALAREHGIGLKRHGKGFVVTDLSQVRSSNAKASLAGLGAPALESKLGAWAQSSDGISKLRQTAGECPNSYSKFYATEPQKVAVVDAFKSSRREGLKKVRKLESKIKMAHLDDAHDDYKSAVAASSTSNERKLARLEYARRKREFEQLEQRVKKEARDALAKQYAARDRTPLALKDAASYAPHQLARSGDPSVSIAGVRVTLIVAITLEGLETQKLEDGRVVYWRGDSVVLVDDGDQVHVWSEVVSDIKDAIVVLLARDPEAAERGITITGSDVFRQQAMQAVAEMGLTLANQDRRMQSAFSDFMSTQSGSDHQAHLNRQSKPMRLG